MRAKIEKEFDRKVCFTFFEDYRKTAKEIEDEYGKDEVALYYNAIIDYALYGIEPEMKGVIRFVWHTTKSTIDKSIERRSNGFVREDTDKTEKVLEYKKQNPNATQREIAEATGISVGKVNKVLKNNLISNTDTNTDTITKSFANTTSEREYEHVSQKCSDDKREIKKNRILNDLTKKEKEEIVKHFRNGTMQYSEMYKHYGLTSGCLTKDTIFKLEKEIKKLNAIENKENEKMINRDALTLFNLNQNEGDELCNYLFENQWEDFGEKIIQLMNELVENTRLSLKGLLQFLRENEYARVTFYNKHVVRIGDTRLIINQKYRWENYWEYLISFIANPEDVFAKVKEYIAEKSFTNL